MAASRRSLAALCALGTLTVIPLLLGVYTSVMADRTRSIHRFRSIRFLYLAGFLAYLHLTFVVFVNSSFMADRIGEHWVGFLYVIGSLLAIGSFFSVSHLLARIGNYRVLIVASALEILTLIGLSSAHETATLVLLFVMHLAVYPVIFFTLDVFLESYTQPEDGEGDQTGGVRGVYLAIANASFMIAPLLVGWIVGVEERFSIVYAFSAALLVPFLALIALRFRRFIDPAYHTIDFRSLVPTLRSVLANKNLSGVMFAHYLLRLFYAWSIVYLPLYLHSHVGFSWPEIGIILTITLSPYVLFEIPIGRIADRWLGEKEMMGVGFVILGGTFGAVSVMETASIIPWIALIFLAEVGATLVEITSESYFFKQVSDSNANLISLFRTIQPAAYVTGVFVASLFLLFVPLKLLFLVFGGAIILGLYGALSITDTR